MLRYLAFLVKDRRRQLKSLVLLLIGLFAISWSWTVLSLGPKKAMNLQDDEFNTNLDTDVDERELFIMSLKNETIYKQFPDFITFHHKCFI